MLVEVVDSKETVYALSTVETLAVCFELEVVPMVEIDHVAGIPVAVVVVVAVIVVAFVDVANYYSWYSDLHQRLWSN